MLLLRFALVLLCLFTLSVSASAATRSVRVAVLDFGETETGRRASKELSSLLSKSETIEVVDESQTRAAVSGIGYKGSLNMTLEEARDLGAAIGCDFYLTGDAQTVRRSSSAVPVYYEAYSSVFLVSARTGRLLLWQRPSAEAATPAEAEKLLAAKMAAIVSSIHSAVERAAQEEFARREQEMTAEVLEMENLPEEDSPDAKAFRAPHPFRRVRPPYPETASRAEAEASVDASVAIDEHGNVASVEIVRWAGFGLDDSIIDTVRQLRFRPAMRDGAAIPVRVLLRYNFRRPQRDARQTVEPEKRLGPAFKELIRSHKQL